jgi:hypothetical protein
LATNSNLIVVPAKAATGFRRMAKEQWLQKRNRALHRPTIALRSNSAYDDWRVQA